MLVGRDGDQLLPGAAPEFKDAPALPIRAGPVEVDCGPAAREHEVVQPRVRVERLTHEAPRPFRWFQGEGRSPSISRSSRRAASAEWSGELATVKMPMREAAMSS